MTYHQDPVYADLGYTADEMRFPYCGNLPATSTEICRSSPDASGTGFGSNRGVALAQQPGVAQSIAGSIGSIFGTFLGTRGAPPPGMMPGGIPPPQPFPIMPIVVIGGLGLLAVLLLRRRGNPARGRRRTSPKASKFISRRMRDFYAGRMRSSSGRRVRSSRQALAIAYSEARSKGMRVPRRR